MFFPTRARSLLLATLTIAAAACGRGGGAAPPSAPSDKLGQSVSFALPTDDGSLVSIPNGRTTVLDFFGPTCEPCKESVPALLAKRQAIAAKRATIVLVGVLADGESTADAQRALKRWGVESPFLVDTEGTGQREVGVKSLPATIVIDANGKVVWIAPASASADDIVAAVPQ